jgi:hypothetical protein
MAGHDTDSSFRTRRQAEVTAETIYGFVIPDPPPGGSDADPLLNVKMDPGVRQDDVTAIRHSGPAARRK